MPETDKQKHIATIEKKVLELRAITGLDVRTNSHVMFVYKNISGSYPQVNHRRYKFLNDLIAGCKAGLDFEQAMNAMTVIKSYSTN